MDGSSRANAAGSVVHESTTADEPAWLIRYEGDDMEVLSKGETTGQLEPRKLCQWLLERCLERGVQLHQPARVTSVSKDARDELAGVRILSLKDGVETDSKLYTGRILKYYNALTIRFSSLHEARLRSRSMDAHSLLETLPFLDSITPSISFSRILNRSEIPSLDRRAF